MTPDNIIQENKAIPNFYFEYFMQKNKANLLDIVLEKSCFFEYTGADGLGMIHCLIEMYRIRKELQILDEKKAYGTVCQLF